MSVPQLRPDFIESPIPARCSPKMRSFVEIMARHRRAIEQGLPAYQDPTSGLMVFTARFLADRNYCCSSGCRHCPYVPEEKSRKAPPEA